METHVTGHRGGFNVGVTKVLSWATSGGIDVAFYMVRLEAGTALDVPPVFHQCGAIVLAGAGKVTMCPKRGEELPEVAVKRSDPFTGLPHVFLLPRGAGLSLESDEGLDIALVSVPGQGGARPIEIPPDAVRVEERGTGAYQRQVRMAADGSNARGWGLVIGEAVTPAGRWSSYPPHHQPQPVLFYHRFDKPQGYGHAEIGDAVVKVRSHDLTLVRSGEDHAQVAAPGYGMWQLFVIRNLKDQPYDQPEYAEDHRWLLTAK